MYLSHSVLAVLCLQVPRGATGCQRAGSQPEEPGRGLPGVQVRHVMNSCSALLDLCYDTAKMVLCCWLTMGWMQAKRAWPWHARCTGGPCLLISTVESRLECYVCTALLQ
jgi:hypothetical protein